MRRHERFAPDDPREVVKAALVHVVQNKVEVAYLEGEG